MIVFLCIMVLFAFNIEALPLQEFQEIPSAVEDLIRHKDVKINYKTIRGPSVPVLNLAEKENQSGKGKQGELLGIGKESTDDKGISLEEYVRQHRKETNTYNGESANLTVSQEHPKSHTEMRNITINVIQQASNFKEERNERNKHPHNVPTIIKAKVKTSDKTSDNQESSNHAKDKSKTSDDNDTSVHNKIKVSSMNKTTGHQELNDKKYKGETHESARPTHHKKDHGHEEKKAGGFMKFFTKKLQIGNKSAEHEKFEHSRNESIDETKKQTKGTHPHTSEKESKQKNDKLRKIDKESEAKATPDKASHLHRPTNKTKVKLADVSHYIESQDCTAQLTTGIDSSDAKELRQHNASKTLQRGHNSLGRGPWGKTGKNEQHVNASTDRKAPVKSNELILRIVQKKLNESSGIKYKPEDAFKSKTKKLFDMKNKQQMQTTKGATFNDLLRNNRTKTKQKVPDKGKSVVILDRKHDIIQNRTKGHEYKKQSDKEDDSYESRPELGSERTHEYEEHEKVSNEEDDERNNTIEKQFESNKGVTEFPAKEAGDSKSKDNEMVKILPAVKKPVGHQDIGCDSDIKSRVKSPYAMKPTVSKSNIKGSNKHRIHVNGTVRPHHLDKDTPANNEQKNGGRKDESVSTPSVSEINTIVHGNRSEIHNEAGSNKLERSTEPIKSEEPDDIYIDASQINAENNLQDADIPLDEQNDITDNHRFESNVHEQKVTESSTSETPQLHTSVIAEEWASTSAQDDLIPSNQTSEVTISATKSEQDCSNTEERMFINTETSTEEMGGNENSEEGSVDVRKWKQYNTALHQEEESGSENNDGPQLANVQNPESTRSGTVSEGMELPVWGVQNFRSSTPMTMD